MKKLIFLIFLLPTFLFGQTTPATLAYRITSPMGDSVIFSIAGTSGYRTFYDAAYLNANFLRSGTTGVTSVALSLPSIFTVSGSPVTSTGTLAATLNTQTAKTFFAGPATGSAASPTFRVMVIGDLPATGTPSGSNYLRGDGTWSTAVGSVVNALVNGYGITTLSFDGSSSGVHVIVDTTSSTAIVSKGRLATNFTGYAKLASPALTGTPTAPTATTGTNTTQIATTAFVLANAGSSYSNGYGLNLSGSTFSLDTSGTHGAVSKDRLATNLTGYYLASNPSSYQTPSSTGTFTNKTLASSTDVLGGVTMTFGSDATGDIYYRSSGSILTRLPVGSTGSLLGVSGGLPSWVSPGNTLYVGDGTLTANRTVSQGGFSMTFAQSTPTGTSPTSDFLISNPSVSTSGSVTWNSPGLVFNNNAWLGANTNIKWTLQTIGSNFNIYSNIGGGGNNAILQLSGSTGVVTTQFGFSTSQIQTPQFFINANTTLNVSGTFSGSGTGINFNRGTNTASSGNYNPVAITQTINQTGSASFTASLTNITKTGAGSGPLLFQDYQVGGASFYNIGLDGHIFMPETNNKFINQATLVSGTKAITITGVTAASRVFITFVGTGGTVSTTWQYQGVCTTNTLTLTAITNTGTTDTTDTSTLNYVIIN